jgi:hypothetical protein
VRGAATNPSFQKRGIGTSKVGISTGEELLDLEELPDPCREFGQALIWNYADRALPNAKSILNQPLGAICAEIPGLARRLRVSLESWPRRERAGGRIKKIVPIRQAISNISATGQLLPRLQQTSTRRRAVPVHALWLGRMANRLA